MVRGVLYYSTMCVDAARDESRRGEQLARACIAALTCGPRDARDPCHPLAAPAAILRPPRGKPFVAGAPCFSVSHSAPLVACAAVAQGEVGLDVECDAAIDRLTLATICDPAELELARELGVGAVWVAKEAALKAGGGTVEQLASVRVDARGARFRGNCYHAHRLEIDGRWPACIMTSAAGVRFDVRRVA